jgi:hypothetical protein
MSLLDWLGVVAVSLATTIFVMVGFSLVAARKMRRMLRPPRPVSAASRARATVAFPEAAEPVYGSERAADAAS